MTTITMAPLLERGRTALVTRFSILPIEDRPIGTSMDLILESDFCANAELCFRHVESTGRSLHVICGSEMLCVRVDRISEWKEWRRP